MCSALSPTAAPREGVNKGNVKAFWREGRLAGREGSPVLITIARGPELEGPEIHSNISERVEMILSA